MSNAELGRSPIPWWALGLMGGVCLLMGGSGGEAATLAYWRFDEADASADVDDGTGHGLVLKRLSGAARRVKGLVATPLPPDAASEQPNAWARAFDKGLFVCEQPVAQYAKGASFTLEGSFRAELGEGLRMLAGTRSDTKFQGWVLWASGNLLRGSHIGLYIEGPSKKEILTLRARPQVDDGKVHHFAIVWDNTEGDHGAVSLYLDGMLEDEADLPFEPAYNGEFMVGGRAAPGHEAYWTGTLDEMRLSDGALAPGEFLIHATKEGSPMARRAGAVLAEVSVAGVRPAGAPRYSDVCFSSRWFHPTNAKDPHDTFKTAKAFHATRLDWVYTMDPKFIGRAKALGMGFYTALNTILTDGPGLRTREKGRILNLKGERVCAPWMVAWSGYWGCANSPDYRRTFLGHAKRCIDAGTDGFQVDDPGLNVAAIAWGGCYCPHCVAGFREFLKTNTTADERAKLGITDIEAFDYKAYVLARDEKVPARLRGLFRRFQVEAVTTYYADMRAAIDAHAKRRVPMSSNNYGGRWGFPYDFFDYGIAEYPHRAAKPAALRAAFVDARRRGKAQLFTFVSRDVALTRRMIATCYACGGHLIVPWDVYMGTGKPRYYAGPADYADLYAFVRVQAALFDGYEEAAAAGKGIRDRRHRKLLPVAIAGAGDVYAFARAKPGDREAPVVVHLVDWSEQPKAFKVTLLNAKFFGKRPLTAKLLVPGAEPRELPGVVAEEGVTVFQIPALAPWGVLVVLPR